MEITEIRAAASSAAVRIGQERIDFIKASYPNAREYWAEIEHIADMIDDYTNNIREREL